MPLTVPVILLLNAFYWLCCVTFSSGFNEEVCSSVQHLNATLQPGVVLDLLSMSFCVFWFLQESTMACTAARDAKASLKGQSARIWPTHAETIRSAWLTSARGTAASTAATRSASPWAWSGKVCVQDVRLLYCFDFNSWNVLPIYCLLAYLQTSLNLFFLNNFGRFLQDKQQFYIHIFFVWFLWRNYGIFKSYPNVRADWDVTVLPMCSWGHCLIEINVVGCASSGTGREAAWKRAWWQRGGIYQQFQRGHACGQDSRCWTGRGAQNGDV